MSKILSDLLDWPGIEEIVFSESADPHRLLGPHVREDGILIQTFIPTAETIQIRTGDGEEVPMTKVDEAGFFAALLPGDRIPSYYLDIVYDNGTAETTKDPYSFSTLIGEEDLRRFAAGTHYEIGKILGAHPAEVQGTAGVAFAVWAPEALRVSVVGDFNLWDGRRHPMRRLGESGIFELFVPGLKAGVLYKYEIKTPRKELLLKADPYAFYSELRPRTASVVWDLSEYPWTDGEWLSERCGKRASGEPMAIYEIHPGSFLRREREKDERGSDIAGTEFYNYRELAARIGSYVKETGYTHVELMPVEEYPLDASWGYETTGFYAPTSRFGTPDDFRYFVDYLHSLGIGVILDWVPARFPKDFWGLARFDGSALYESPDPKQGEDPRLGTCLFHYRRNEVSNFLIGSALFWANEYHADGLRLDAVSSMLWLDYDRKPGEWEANIYGGRENLDAVEFFRHLGSLYKILTGGAVLLAEESSGWPKVTAPVEEDGLGFDFKWNDGWKKNFLSYLKAGREERSSLYNILSHSMLYAYSENYVLALSHDDVSHGRLPLIRQLPEEKEQDRFSLLKAAYGFLFGHPGKKLIFMGQDFGVPEEWDGEHGIPWELLDKPLHRGLWDCIKAMLAIYRRSPALWAMDDSPEGFEWINCMEAEKNLLVFLRKTEKPEDTLLFICNFSPEAGERLEIGVPFEGKYKEILNTGAEAFGGPGGGNLRAKQSRPHEIGERKHSITVNVPPYSTLIFDCVPKEAPQEEKAQDGTAGAPEADDTAGRSRAAKDRRTIGESVKSAAEAAAETAAERAGQAAQSAKTAAEAAAERAGKAARSARTAAAEAAGAAAEKAGQAARSARAAAAEAAGAAAEKAGQTARSARAAAAEAAAEAAGAAAERAGRAARSAKKAAGDAADTARKAVKTVRNAVKGEKEDEL